MAHITLRISQTIMNDLMVRCPDEEGAWKGIDDAGTHTVSEEQARQIAADCDYQGNITGDWIDPVSRGLTRTYRALYEQVQRELASNTRST